MTKSYLKSKSLVCVALMGLPFSVMAQSVQQRADAMIEHTEHHQLAATFNIEGGYRVVKGSSTCRQGQVSLSTVNGLTHFNDRRLSTRLSICFY